MGEMEMKIVGAYLTGRNTLEISTDSPCLCAAGSDTCVLPVGWWYTVCVAQR